MFQTTLTTIIMAFAAFAASQAAPAICLWDPVLNVVAGSELTAKITALSTRRCLAELAFSDTTFLPITWSFSSPGCVGVETATITVPKGVPNGDAFITWDCAGDNTAICVHVSLANGTANLESTPIQQTGVVQCSYSSPTTLLTRTSSSPTGTSTSQSVPNSNSVAVSTGTASSAPIYGRSSGPTEASGRTSGPTEASGRPLNPTSDSSIHSPQSAPISSTTGVTATAIASSGSSASMEADTDKSSVNPASTLPPDTRGEPIISSNGPVTVTVTACATPPTRQVTTVASP